MALLLVENGFKCISSIERTPSPPPSYPRLIHEWIYSRSNMKVNLKKDILLQPKKSSRQTQYSSPFDVYCQIYTRPFIFNVENLIPLCNKSKLPPWTQSGRRDYGNYRNLWLLGGWLFPIYFTWNKCDHCTLLYNI